MNIAIVGAHIDDPESGCGGWSLHAAAAGHQVHFIYLTSGKPTRQISGRPEAEVREAEGLAACKKLGVTAHFLRQPAGDLTFNQAGVRLLSDRLREIDADIVATHWPVDTHPDHQAAGILATQTVVGNPGVALVYYEVITGIQTMCFTPNRWVDISTTSPAKWAALECFASQDVGGWRHYHDAMEVFRGQEFNVAKAEAYHLAVSTPGAEALFAGRNEWRPSGSRRLRTVKHEDVDLRPD